jgi:PAS domain S-box-containing protein
MHIFDRMDQEVIKAIIETLPLEITVIDHNDEVVGWNQHDTRLFARPLTSMGLNFRECHPKESLDRVERIVDEMKSGKRDKARFWINIPVKKGGEKHKILIEFYALRDKSGKYLGCMECTQDIEELIHLEGEKKLLDEKAM